MGLALLAWGRAGAEPALVEHVQRGEALAAQGQVALAIGEYEKALEEGAGSALVLNRLAAFYLQVGELEKANKTLRRSLQENPGQPQVCFELARTFQAIGQPDSALPYAIQARDLAPESSAIHTLVGLLQLEAGQLQETRAALDRALELDPRNPEAHRFLGVYYTRLDSLEPAIAQFQQVARILPEDLEAHNNIGFLLARQQRYDQALEAYERARELARDPELLRAIAINMEAVQAIRAGKMRARYILVDTQAQAREVLQRLQKGEDFEALAAQFSRAANGRDGGDTGFFGPGELLEEFEKAVLQLDKGQISEPLAVPLGVMVIQRLN